MDLGEKTDSRSVEGIECPGQENKKCGYVERKQNLCNKSPSFQILYQV